VHELRREIIGKGWYLERGSTAARVNGVQLDPIKLIIGKERDELARLCARAFINDGKAGWIVKDVEDAVRILT
jgi:hypothetical protein